MKAMAIAGVAAMLLGAGAAMGANVEVVPVGNPHNAGELSGAGAGGDGPDRVCGAVDYTYNIGKYEVTAGQYTEFLNAVADTDAYGLYNTNMSSSGYGCKIERTGSSGGYTYSVAADRANRPVNYVSWADAARFANWLHNGQPEGSQVLATTEDGAYFLNGATTNSAILAVNREPDWRWAITSEDEWYKAAYYDPGMPGYYHYPTGSNTAPGQDMADVSGNNANYMTAPYVFPIDSDKYSTVGGEFQNSGSPYGTFDQGGNVWEWTESRLYTSSRGLRGGGFDNFDYDLLASFRGVNGNAVGQETQWTGFRVSQVPEPASMAVLALGSVGMLLRRRAPIR